MIGRRRRSARPPLAPVSLIDVDLHAELAPLSADPSVVGLRLVLWSTGVPVGHVDVPAARLPLSPDDERLTAARRDAATGLPGPPVEPRADDVTVVVCTRDRTEELARCLAALRRSTAPAARIVVVDNAPSTEDTRLLVDRTPGVQYVREPRPGLDIARNTGLAAADTDLVAYTDDDAEPHPDWTWRIRTAFDDDPSVLAVTGLVLPAALDTEAQVLFEAHAGFGRGYERRDFEPAFLVRDRRTAAPVWEIGAGANMAFRRAAVEAAGGFDERLDVGAAGCSGDSEMWYRLLARGGRCRYEPSAVVRHHHRRDEASLRRQMFFYMRGHACALLVQYERSGHVANLRRLFLVLPVWYARSTTSVLLRRVRGARRPEDALLVPQVRGCLSGVLFFLRSRPATGERTAELHGRREIIVARARRWPQLLARALPGPLDRRLRAAVLGAHYRPPVRSVDFGDLRRTSPLSRQFGFDRGQPVDRYYIEDWLAKRAGDIRGRVLEVGDDSYTRRFGGGRVAEAQVLHLHAGNPSATYVTDLASGEGLPDGHFDCLVLTQTLHLVYDVAAALRTAYRVLRPGGVLLASFPGISQRSDDEWAAYWCWAFTSLSATRLFHEAFPPAGVTVESHGNVLAAISLLAGIAAEELTVDELSVKDPSYEVLVTVRAVRPSDPAPAPDDAHGGTR